MLPGILSIVIGYLLGSVPTAYIVSRVRKGIDIRNIGSGNMGGANVMREVGTHEGVFVGLIDVAKGAGAILIAQALDIPGLWVFGTGFAAFSHHYRYLSRASPQGNTCYTGSNSYSILYQP